MPTGANINRTRLANNLQEVINDALRRYVESHQELLTEAFIEEDVEWGLHGDDC